MGVKMWPANTCIHVSTEEQGQIVIDYFAEYGYTRSSAHARYPYSSYPYLRPVELYGEDDGHFKITGHSIAPDSINTIEFEEWWDEVYPSEFEPAESLDMLFA